jgi:hypothetical protein
MKKVEKDFYRLFIDHPLYDMTASKFSLEIEKLVKEQKVDYLEAATQLCERFEIDYNDIKKLISPTMKDKIEVAATERKYRL